MKLPTPLTGAQRQRAQAALGKLQSAHAAFEAKLKTFADATATHSTLERQIEGARSRLGGTAESTDALVTKLAAIKQVCQTRKGEMEDARASAVDAIGCAGKLVREIAAPMAEQFKRGLVSALQPFCTDPAAAVAALPTHHTELPALQAFLARGLHVSRTTTAEDLEFLKYDLCQTLQSLLDGGHVWKLPREAFSPSFNSATHLAAHTSMKLPTLSADQFSHVQTAAKTVESVLTNLPGWIGKVAALQREDAELEAEATRLTASGAHDKTTVQGLAVVGPQREILAGKIKEARRELAQRCQDAAGIVRGASGVIFQTVWGPLSSQIRLEVNRGLIGALTPFGATPFQAAIGDDEFNNLPIVRDLWAFVNHGKSLGVDAYNHRPTTPPPDAVLRIAGELKATLAQILAGQDCFVFQPQAKAA